MESTAYCTAGTNPAHRAAEWERVIADTYFPLHLTFRDADRCYAIAAPVVARFGLGQIVRHAQGAFRGVVVDVDPVFAGGYRSLKGAVN